MKLLGLLGYPLSHSFSPIMINRIARQKNWDCAYFAFSIAPKDVKDFVKTVKLLPIYGFNITIPYKQVILKYCDEISPEAKEIGAANTVINNAGNLKAYNTDVFGFMFAIKNLMPKDVEIKGSLIIGAGGAARAVVYSLSKIGCKNFYLTDVNPKREKEWQKQSSVLIKDKKLKFIFPDKEILSEILSEVNLVIQASPVGTYPKNEECVSFPFNKLTQVHYIYDLVYNPLETKFVKLAKDAGVKATNGLDMLAAQAVNSLDYWGYTVEFDVLFKALLEEIQQNN